MPRRQPKPRRPVPSGKPPEPAAGLRRALTKRKKSELVDVLMELAAGGPRCAPAAHRPV